MPVPHPILRHVLNGCPHEDADLISSRAQRWLSQVQDGLRAVYPDDEVVLARCLDVVVDTVSSRPADLRRLDRHREINPDWFSGEDMVGYVAYLDRFTGDLPGLTKALDYLEELHVSYLHLMPLLKPRPQPNDGGYAVMDYDAIDPRVGTVADLEAATAELRARGISICVDVVLNHTAAEHDWAERARRGESRYRAYYRTFADRTMPDRWEQTLPEVFPDTAPGNFTFDEALGEWVWTTFNPWQWDLDWSNPDVFVEMLGVMARLAQRGVDVLRLDAIPFLWKQLGTTSQNLPEVHSILQALRGLMGMAAPATILKGEAIVAPDDLVPYQGVGRRLQPECDLLYHNQLMVQSWSSLAAQDGRLATLALGRMAPTPPHASWVTYVRCHDDIGWAIHDDDAGARGWEGSSHRRFLSGFFAGELDYSYAKGAHFQEDFVSGDRRTSGTTAALVGIQAARAELQSSETTNAALDDAISRLLLLYALAASYGGIPLVYMGDEVALDNDTAFLLDPDQAADNRWMHRPRMDWSVAERRHDQGSVEQRVHSGLAEILRIRTEIPALRGGGTVTSRTHDNNHVLAFRRDHPRTGPFLGLANFSPTAQFVNAEAVGLTGIDNPVDALKRQAPANLVAGCLVVPALGMCWITDGP